ncbi:hypothetical protein BJV77DRAFT_1007734, partial [Russula vinacea]
MDQPSASSLPVNHHARGPPSNPANTPVRKAASDGPHQGNMNNARSAPHVTQHTPDAFDDTGRCKCTV